MFLRIKRMRVVFLLLAALVLAGCAIPGLSTGGPPPPPQTAAPAAATATPTLPPEPTPVALDATLQFEEGGFLLHYPQGWYTNQAASMLTIAPNEDAVHAPTPGQHLVMFIDSTPLDETTSASTEQQRAQLHNFFETSSAGPVQAGYTISATTPLTISGNMGLQADLRADWGAGRLAVILAPPQVVRILGQSSPDSWEAHSATFEGIIESISFFTPPVLPTPTPENHAIQPQQTRTGGLPGFVLRLGGNEGPPEGRFVSARGLDAGPDGVVYLAESGRGIWVFAPDGTLIATFGDNDLLLDAYDVDRGPNGDLFVADNGRNAIVRLSPNGTLIQRWGEIGDGEAQFGLQSPQRIAVGADGSVYALDSHPDPQNQSTHSSVIRFNGNDGSFMQRISLPSGSAPTDLAVDASGILYLAEPTDRVILKMDTEGNILARLGEQASPGGISAGAIDLDRQGNIYVATWNDGILRLSPNGTLLSTIGSIADPGSLPQPGQFSLPQGIAVAPGGIVWVSDNAGEYSAITAMRLFTDTGGLPPAAPAAPAPSQTTTTAPTAPMTTTNMLRQWASSASASSHYGDEYAPDGATGPPDVEGCTDSPDAWAPATPDSLETLELEYDTPVFAAQVNIHQTHQPGFIAKVEVRDESGSYTTVYEGEARLASACPDVMQVSFTPTLFPVRAVRLTIDQRQDANWSEIDAVELSGLVPMKLMWSVISTRSPGS